jgi:hypothetical protein
MADFHALVIVSRPGKKQTTELKMKIPRSMASRDGHATPTAI